VDVLGVADPVEQRERLVQHLGDAGVAAARSHGPERHEPEAPVVRGDSGLTDEHVRVGDGIVPAVEQEETGRAADE